MNDDNHGLDPRLEALFRREHTHLPAERFLSATLHAVAKTRRRSALRKSFTAVALFVAFVVLSPRLVGVSGRLSMRLDELIASATTWLASPLGVLCVVMFVLAAIATKWARVW